jgi:hypothetical protein
MHPEHLPTGPSEIEASDAALDTAPLNDPLFYDVAREVAATLAEKVPVVGTALRTVSNRAAERRLRLMEQTLHRLDLSFEELNERLRDDEDLAELVGRAFNIVAEARSDEKVRVLAAVVASAVRGERVDVSTAHVLMGVLQQLEPVHLQTLVDVDNEAARAHEGPDPGTPRGAQRQDLEELSTIDGQVLAVVLADLEAKQLIQNVWEHRLGESENEAFVLTILGDDIRALLLEVELRDPLPPADEAT